MNRLQGYVSLVLALIMSACSSDKTFRQFHTSFESLDDVAGFYVVPQNHRNSASHELSTEVVHSGKFAHKAWIYAANPVIQNENTNHRAYPTIQLYKLNGGAYRDHVTIELWVWLDIPINSTPDMDWVSFATFTSYADDFWYRVLLVNLNKDGYVEFMHGPHQYAGSDIFQSHTVLFPQKTWVKFKVYLDYTTQNDYHSPYAKLWQNDDLVSVTRFNPRVNPLDVDRALWPDCLAKWDQKSIEAAERLCNLQFTDGLAQAHFGLYAPPLLSSGVIYNDDLMISEVP